MVGKALLLLALVAVGGEELPPYTPPVDLARSQVIAAGYKLSPGVPQDPENVAAYDPNTRSILINSWNPYWDDRANRTIWNHRAGWFSTPHFDHILRHEFGHAELHKAIGTARWTDAVLSAPPLPRIRVSAAVSGYAAWSAAEFHAEVFAGLAGGRKFPDDVMKAYEILRKP